MIYTYGITMQGTAHIEKNIVCQDAHKIVKCDKNMVIAAVGDGLGSEKHSDIASKIAVEISTEYCKQNIVQTSSADEILNIIKTSFFMAQRAIEKAVKERGHSLDQYDTTLSAAVLINDTLYYGHSGDSGIVALTTEGLYEKVTEQQRDEYGRVFPLFFEDRWVFGQFDKKVRSVLLATDGILETLFPEFLKCIPASIRVDLAQFFMDNQKLRINDHGEETVKAYIENYIKNIKSEEVQDDKTVVALINSSVEAGRQPEDYYKKYNWEEIKRVYHEEWKRQAYPNLFSGEVVEPAVILKSDNETPPANVLKENQRKNIIKRALEYIMRKNYLPVENNVG